MELFKNNSNATEHLVLCFSIKSYGYTSMNNMNFKCNSFTDEMKKRAGKPFKYNHPLTNFKGDCVRSKKVNTVKIIPDHILCDYFNIKAPSLTIGRI